MSDARRPIAVAIDGSNLRAGGGATRLCEVNRAADSAAADPDATFYRNVDRCTGEHGSH